MGFQTDLYWLNTSGEITRREEGVIRYPVGYRQNPRLMMFAGWHCCPRPRWTWLSRQRSFQWGCWKPKNAKRSPVHWSWHTVIAGRPCSRSPRLSALFAWICARRQAKYAQPWTKTWVVFVFLLGLPGLLGYLWHRRWPVLEKCPSCQAASPRDRLACPRCHADFPEPGPVGLEVLA